MRRLLPLLLTLSLACSVFAPATPTPVPSATVPPLSAMPVPSATRAPTATVAPRDSASATPSAAPSAEPEFSLKPEHIRFQPAPRLYAGDIVSVEVVAEGAPDAWEGAPVRLYVGAREAAPLAESSFGRFGLGGRLQATFTWVWDTHGLEGRQTLWVVAGPAPLATPPVAEQIVEVVADLLPAAERPMPEPLARWATAESECCLFHYLTGTAAERDLETIRATADEALAQAEAVLGVERTSRIEFTLLSRLVGHGGFASSEISISYLDRNPVGNDLFNLFAHEGTHLLDRKFAQVTPTLMTEGLAVFVAGGHFTSQDLERRAAALVALDRYLPLATLADSFYPAQHETGYLEGGAFITYLVGRFGWERFKAMYGSFQGAPSDAAMLDQGLQRAFGASLDELEAGWLRHLRAQPRDPAEEADLDLTVELYDTLRRYQQALDPSAYFLTAWLPDGPRARERRITADFVRHPVSPDSIALEAMLQAAGDDLLVGDTQRAGELLEAVNTSLDAGSLAASRLASDYLAVVDDLLAEGYEPQSIRLAASSAEATAIREWPSLESLSLMRAAGGWRVVTATVAR